MTISVSLYHHKIKDYIKNFIDAVNSLGSPLNSVKTNIFINLITNFAQSIKDIIDNLLNIGLERDDDVVYEHTFDRFTDPNDKTNKFREGYFLITNEKYNIQPNEFKIDINENVKYTGNAKGFSYIIVKIEHICTRNDIQRFESLYNHLQKAEKAMSIYDALGMERELMCFCVKLYDCDYFTLFEKNKIWNEQARRMITFIRKKYNKNYTPCRMLFSMNSDIDSISKKYGIETALMASELFLIKTKVMSHTADINLLNLINKADMDIIDLFVTLPDSVKTIVIDELDQHEIKTSEDRLIEQYKSTSFELNRVIEIYNEFMPSGTTPEIFDKFQNKIKSGKPINLINKELKLDLDNEVMEKIKDKYDKRYFDY